MTTQRNQTIRTFLRRMILWTVADAAVGALSATLFGMIYGKLEMLARGDPSKITLTAAYFSIVGAIAGALLGAFGAFVEGGEAWMPESKGGAILPAKCSYGAPAHDEAAEDSVSQRPTAPANPLIARWQFVERIPENEAVVWSNGNRLPTNGCPTTGHGSRVAGKRSHLADGYAEATESRRPLHHVRRMSDDEAND